MLKAYKSSTNEELKKAIDVCDGILKTDILSEDTKKSFQKCKNTFQEEMDLRKKAWDILQSEIESLTSKERIS